jgi:DNA-binding transcriptional MerR regulator
VFRISDFSRLTRVTVKTLRYYDRLGLLVPARVDERTRYRYYLARQVLDLERILALRDLGFALEHVRELLGRGPARASLARALRTRRVALERELEDGRLQLARLDARLAELRSDGKASADAVVRAIPPVRVARLRARVAQLDDGVEELFETVEREAAEAGVRADGPPILIYRDRDHREREASVEVAVPVLTHERKVGRAAVATLPGLPMAACVVYAGSYERWSRVVRGLLGWLESRRLEPAGPIREVFLQFGTREGRHAIPPAYLTDRAEDQLTEVQIPVRARPRGRRARG